MICVEGVCKFSRLVGLGCIEKAVSEQKCQEGTAV